MSVDQTEAASVEETYEALQPVLRYVLCGKYRIPIPDAENIIQEIFLNYFVQHDRIRDGKAWLFAAARNSSHAYWRSQGRTPVLAGRLSDDADPRSLEREHSMQHDLRAILQQLDHKCRQLFELHYFQGYSLGELAAKLSTSSPYVKTMLHRCREHARAAYRRLTRGAV